ncbi:hypothetical protein CYMTET_48810 [Cymbomonas tetramitiformis]|uniref:Uncharacterized protein n=1 Tax=Cymbomonas tetramitiformis TaxID=36881 RepID=A0AAE0BRG6_9CHLO|nr:hypothetical protein CYMTET_48810 [Cymbomonas tetramitiformis]
MWGSWELIQLCTAAGLLRLQSAKGVGPKKSTHMLLSSSSQLPCRAITAKRFSHVELALGRVGGSGVLWDVGLVVKGWLDWRSSGGRDEPASGTSQQCAGVADADGLGWLSEA